MSDDRAALLDVVKWAAEEIDPMLSTPQHLAQIRERLRDAYRNALADPLGTVAPQSIVELHPQPSVEPAFRAMRP